LVELRRLLVVVFLAQPPNSLLPETPHPLVRLAAVFSL
jgi:hypothetical protein